MYDPSSFYTATESWIGWRSGYPHDHYDVIKWKHFPRHWPFVRGIHRSPVNSPHKGQWRAALMYSLICVWTNSWVNNRDAGDLRRHSAHYDVTIMAHGILIFTFISKYRGIKSNHSEWPIIAYLFVIRNFSTVLIIRPCSNCDGNNVKTPLNLGYKLFLHMVLYVEGNEIWICYTDSNG